MCSIDEFALRRVAEAIDQLDADRKSADSSDLEARIAAVWAMVRDIDPRAAEMLITSAGMPGPFHLSDRGCRVLQIPGIPPGLFPEAEYETATLTLQPGDSVLFCTDGITDAFSIRDESFGISRVQALCEHAARIPPSELLRRIFAAVETFTQHRDQHDDMAAVVFHYGLLTTHDRA